MGSKVDMARSFAPDAVTRELQVAEFLERASALFRLAEALEDKKSRSLLFEAAFEFERLAQRMATIH